MHRTHFPVDALKNWVKTWNKRETEGGQSIVILVLGLVGLLAFAGLVFDGGTAYAQFRRMQNAADAGALAGAQELSKKKLPGGITDREVYQAAARFAKDPAYGPVYGGQSDPTIKVQYIIPPDRLHPVPANGGAQPPDSATGVRVTVETSFKTFFLGFVAGLGRGSVTAHSSAEYGPAIPINVQPLAKRCIPSGDPTDPCSLHIGIYGEIWQSQEPGNLGWLGFNGDTSERNLREELNPDLPPKPYVDDMTVVDGVPRIPCKTLAVDCWVQGSTGVSDSRNIRENLDTYWKRSSVPMVIILYDRELEGGANTEFHIVGFAAFMMDDYDLSGHIYGQKSMFGTFVRWMDAAAICKTCADTGFYSVHLIPDVAEPPPAPDAKGKICVSVVYDVDVDGHFDSPEDYYLAGATVTIKNSSGTTVATWNTAGLGTNCTDAVLDPRDTFTVTETNPPGYSDSIGADGLNSRTVLVSPDSVTDVLFLDYYTDRGNIVVLTRDNNGAPLANLTASLKLASNPAVVLGAATSPTGTVYFRNRPSGSYIVSGSPPPGYDMTTDNVHADVTAGSTVTVTLVATPYPHGSVCVTAWDDENTNGTRDAGERALWGTGFLIAGLETRSHTMGDGEYRYCFDNLRVDPAAGTMYRVTEQHIPGYSSASYPTPSPDQQTVILHQGQTIELTFRDYIPPRGNLCVEVFDDVTADGLLTAGEVAVGGANIYIYNVLDLNTPVVTYITNGTEPKCFSVLVGTYKVMEVANVPGSLSTTPDTVNNVGIFKDLAFTVLFGDIAHAPTITPTRTRTVTPTRTNTPPPGATLTPTPTRTPTPPSGALCVLVYNDMNGNGIRDLAPTPTGTPPNTPTGTPTVTYAEPVIAPKKVVIVNSTDVTVGTWDGTGANPHCQTVWAGDYGATETDPLGYGSTTANNVTVSVAGSITTTLTTTAEFGDKLCFASPPVMRDPIWQTGSNWLLQWNNVPGTYYTIYGSSDSNDPSVGTWTIVAEVSDVNYVVTKEHDGTYFYVVATDNCGTSAPSNVARIG